MARLTIRVVTATIGQAASMVRTRITSTSIRQGLIPPTTIIVQTVFLFVALRTG